jgi:hypothetical protein
VGGGGGEPGEGCEGCAEMKSDEEEVRCCRGDADDGG